MGPLPFGPSAIETLQVKAHVLLSPAGEPEHLVLGDPVLEPARVAEPGQEARVAPRARAVGNACTSIGASAIEVDQALSRASGEEGTQAFAFLFGEAVSVRGLGQGRYEARGVVGLDEGLGEGRTQVGSRVEERHDPGHERARVPGAWRDESSREIRDARDPGSHHPGETKRQPVGRASPPPASRFRAEAEHGPQGAARL